MPDYLHLRQVCLAAPSLEPAVDAIQEIFGLDVCHRDDAVAKYGLVNALFVFGHAFLEVVAPIDTAASLRSTAAGRFIERSGGQGGYMAIFDCSDPLERRARAESMGVRIAHTLDYPDFFGSQFHPVDCRATMLEFDHSTGAEDLDGFYGPAGEHWREQQRLDLVSAMPAIEVRSPDPADLAAHWGRIMAIEPQARDDGGWALQFDLGMARIMPAPAGTPERLTAIDVAVPDPDKVLAAAARHGCPVEGDGFFLAGATLRPVAG
ncbi:MAG: VOC family protein [Burkholderiaceae bacterium]